MERPARRAHGDTFATLSLILGACAFFCGFVTGLPAMVLGALAVRPGSGRRARRVGGLGLFLGTTATVISILVILRVEGFPPGWFGDDDQDDRYGVVAPP